MKFEVEKIENFTGHKDSVYTIIQSPNEGNFFSGAGDGMVVEWNSRTPDLGMPVAKVENSIYALHYHEITNELWIGHNYEGIHIVDPKAKAKVGSIALNKMAIFAITGHKSNIFVGSGDGIITVIDAPSKSFKKHLKASDKSVRSLAINPVENDLAAAYSDHSIRIFDLTTFELKKTIPAHKNSVFGIKYSPNFESLYSVSRDAHLKKWNVLKDYELDEEAVAHMYTINDIAFSPSGKYFATCSMDKSIKLWETENFKLRKVIDQSRFAAHGTSINKLLWMSDNDLLACSDDRTISLWKVAPINT
ncbi:WD domain-containing protein, G-beta repeat-containing protein [Spirosomataceae bacterium TFI 002]|nr:WD domain-containing protein, G-beta repeat-containing protein [Spirosomataceae bacterium TFI 002]